MVQIDLKKLREMQGKQDTSTPEEAAPTLEVITPTSDIASSPITPDISVVEPVALTSEEGEKTSLPDTKTPEPTPLVEAITENTGLKLQLSDLHKKPTENLEVLSRQEREKELTEVFGDIVTETEGQDSLVSPSTAESTSTMSKDENKASKNNGFFPGLSFISEPVTLATQKQEPDNVSTDPLPTPTGEQAIKLTDEQTNTQETSVERIADPISDTHTKTSEITSQEELTPPDIADQASDRDIKDGQSISMPPEVISSSMSPMPPPVTTPPSAGSLHPTNKKSLFLVLGALAFMLVCGAGIFAWIYLGGSTNNTPTPPIVEQKATDTLSGETQSGSIDTGSTEVATGSLSQTGASVTQSGSELPVSSGATLTGVVSTGSLAASGTTMASGSTKPGTMSGTSMMSGSTIIKPGTTSTGSTAATTQSGSNNTNSSKTGSTQSTNTPSTNTKYQEGTDYKVYGGGYKLIRNEP